MGTMSRFRRLLLGINGTPLAYQIGEGYGQMLASVLTQWARNPRAHDADLLTITCDADAARSERQTISETLSRPQLVAGQRGQKATAVVSVRGIATFDIEYQPMAFSTLNLEQNIKQLANDPEVGTILLLIDSPGGQVTGTAEAAEAIFKARSKKKVVAMISPLAASAAYWIASQAEEIVAIPSADVGSIGVFMAHTDCSKFNEAQGIKTTYIFAGKYKVEGNMEEPLSDEGRGHYQSEVDTIYKDFIGAVARGRGISTEKVEKSFGQGRTMMAPAAKRAGMIDTVMTFDQAMARYGVTTMETQGRRRAEASAADEFKAITFLSVADNQDAKVYVAEDWPKRARIADPSQWFVSHTDEDSVTVNGEQVTITAPNGRAVYQKIDEGPNGEWLCDLVSGTFESPPAENDTESALAERSEFMIRQNGTSETVVTVDARGAEAGTADLQEVAETVQAAKVRLNLTLDARESTAMQRAQEAIESVFDGIVAQEAASRQAADARKRRLALLRA